MRRETGEIRGKYKKGKVKGKGEGESQKKRNGRKNQ